MGRVYDVFFSLSKTLAYDEKIVIFVHNLSFEFYFLSGVYDFKPDEVQAISRKKIMRSTMFSGKLEFRCSYLHSNMSLAEYTDKWGCGMKKQKMDYSVKRYPWTDLDDNVLYYSAMDVCALVRAVKKEMEFDGDNLYSFPLTSTGYVRRITKKAMRSFPRHKLQKMLPDLDTYLMLRAAARGGNVHANRFYVGEIMSDVYCDDRQSSYPDVQCNDMFPMTEFRDVNNPDEDALLDSLELGYAVLVRVVFDNIELKDRFWPIPYLSRDKGNVSGKKRIDNGRILYAERYETTLTDIDLRIVMDEYKFDKMYVLKLKTASYDMLPEPMRKVIIGLYGDKTGKKGVPGEELHYMKSKNKLNAVFGMSFTIPVREEHIYNTEKRDFKTPDELEDSEKMSMEQKLYSYNEKAFLSYAWGVWTTAWARWRLEEGLKIVYNTPGAILMYCDTDGIYHTKVCDFKAYNMERSTRSKENGAYATDKFGNVQYMGIYDRDGFYKFFCTLGCKKYVGMKNGALVTTIAGVRKYTEVDESGNIIRVGGDVELRDISRFKNGFIFKKAAGNLVTYNNVEPYTVNIDGHDLTVTKNINISENTYTISQTEDYIDLLKDSRMLLNNIIYSRGNVSRETLERSNL